MCLGSAWRCKSFLCGSFFPVADDFMSFCAVFCYYRACKMLVNWLKNYNFANDTMNDGRA